MLSLKDKTTRYFLFVSFIFIPWIVVGSLRAFGPIGLAPLGIEIQAYLLTFVVLIALTFSLSFLLLTRDVHQSTDFIGSVDASGHVFLLCRRAILVAAFLFPAIACFDFFVIKGAALSEIVALREKEHLTGPRGSLIGALSTLFSAASPVAFAVYLLSPSKTLFRRLFVWSVILVGLGCLFLTGGRNAFFISVGFIAVFAFLFLDKKQLDRAISPFFRKAIYILGALGFFYSMKIFVERFEVQGFDAEIMLWHLKTEYSVDVQNLDGASEFYISVYSSWVYLVYYMIHAFTFFEQYITQSVSPELMGVYNFSIVARFVDLVFGTSFVADGIDSLIVRGVYLTLPGSLYVDFGFIGGLVSAAFLGGVYGVLAARLNKLKFYQKMWLVYICTIMLFSPFYSVVGIANGFSFLFLLTIIVVLSFRLKRRAL